MEQAGQAILAGLQAKAADQLRPRVLFCDVIEDITDRQAILINRTRGGSMILPGDSLLVCEVTPALFTALAANEAERAAPGVTLVDVSMIGVAGRIYLSGPVGAVTAARDAIIGVLDQVEGREQRTDGGVSTHDLSTGGDVLDRVTRFAAAGRPGLRLRAGQHGAPAERVGERDLPGRGPGPGAVHPAGAPARLPHRSRDRVRAGLDGRAARPRPGCAPRGCCPPRTASGCWPCPTSRTPPDRRAPEVPQPGALRHCVRFEYLAGTEPADDDAAHFAELGEVTARMHQHARQWPRPSWFTRFSWDYDAAFGREARWGRWQDGIGVGPAERAVLGRLDAVLAARLAAFGTGPDRFGLVHADTRLANLLVDGGRVSVIDFDDSGFSWFLYDVGTSVSFFEHQPHVPDLVASWLAGVPPGAQPARRGRGRDLDVHHVPPAAAGRVDRLAPGRRHRPAARRGIHPGQLRPG